MIKVASIFNFILLLFTSPCFSFENAKVSVQPSIPSIVKPGEEFVVSILVSKGTLENPATLLQYLPEGFTATSIESRGADFIFEKHQIKFTWKNLPAEKSFPVSYRVKTDINCTGLKIFNGEFSFNDKDKTNKIKLPPSVIIVTNNESSSKSPGEWNNDMQVEKLIGPLTAKAGEYRVELKIKKGFNQHAVRIFDQVMEGYFAFAVETKGAKFSAAEGTVEFYWETLPDDSAFSVVYHIVSDRIKIDYSASNLVHSETTESNNQFDSHLSAEPSGNIVTKETQGSTSLVFSSEKGIYFKVQIAATMNNFDRKNDYFQSFYKINKSVEVTLQNGWRIYSIGTFEKYSEAKKCLAETQDKIPGAFVVAYLNGSRIPLQEALKIKN